MDKIINFNIDQVEHTQLVQKLVWMFINDLMKEVLTHDFSKWQTEEYETFVNSRDSLNKSVSGNEEEYQKILISEAVQHHYENNTHHPEYWSNKENSMPLHEIIIMFFDWASRTISKNGNLNDFWDYNIKKLNQCEQFHAIPVVHMLAKHYREKIENDFKLQSERQHLLAQFWGHGSSLCREECSDEEIDVIRIVLDWWNGGVGMSREGYIEKYGESTWNRANSIQLSLVSLVS